MTAIGTGSVQDAVINSKPDDTPSVLRPVLRAPDLSHPPAAVTASRTVTAECGLSGASVLNSGIKFYRQSIQRFNNYIPVDRRYFMDRYIS